MKSTPFSNKAEKYARYRWDYAPEAIQTLFEAAQVGENTTVADIGAGTGILTRHFLGKVKQIYAVEPNPEMREIAARFLGPPTGCQVLEGSAEAIPLPDHSIDLIVVAQAFNWFDPLPTRAEFLRILKPCGWLAALKNRSANPELGEALEKIYPSETDTITLMKGFGIPLSFYYGHENFIRQSFPFSTKQTWEEFLGAALTASYAPEEGSSWVADFEQAAREIFERFRTGEVVISRAVTELCLGQLA